MKKLLFVTLILAFGTASRASHIVGGELYYDCLGNNQYRVTLKLYRDCFCSNCAPFGDPEYLAIFTGTGTLYAQPAMPFPGSVQLSSTFSNPCLVEPSLCVERAIYTTVITLPPNTSGYNIVYQRCCRNDGVNNIPLDQGATYQVHIPGSGQATCNNSPRFNTYPPLFICVNAPLVFNHSATDPDGDQLVYSLCDPYDGAGRDCPSLIPTNSANGVVGTISGQPCPDAPDAPPYSSVAYNSPYSSSNFLNSPSTTNDLRIDPQTGVLTGTPNTQGMFVVAVCVSEYRNGVFLGEMRRDFQFNVAPCNIPVAGIPSTNIDPQSGIGTYVLTCKNYTVNFTNTSYNPPPASNPIYYHWDFGVTNQTNDTSNQFASTFTYPDTGSYLVQLVAIKDAGGGLFCTDTTYAYVYVYPTFSTNFTTINICQDSAAQFASQVISSYGNINLWKWNFGDGDSAFVSNPVHQYANGGTYPVTLIGGNDLGCRDTARNNIVVYPVPQASFTFSNPCINQPVNFNNSSSGNIASQRWMLGNGNVSTQQNPSVTYNATRTYNVSLFLVSPDGCKDTSSQTLTVHPVPDVANNDTTICPGQSVQLRGSGATTYTWTPASGLNDPTIANPIATPTPPSAITYHIAAINQFQCSSSDDVTISFYPALSIVASPDTSVCLSGANFRDSVQLAVTAAVSYVWAPANSLNNPFIRNPIARPTFNTTYSVTGTDVNGCTATDSVTVYVLDPTLNIVVDDAKNVCLHDTTYVNVISQGASNYVWVPAQFLVDETTLHPGFYPSVSTTYTLSISNYCYSKTDSVRIVVLPLPILVFNHPDSVCFGQTIQLSVIGRKPTGGILITHSAL